MTDTSAKMNEPFGRYVLERRIATGGMAEIFLAKQEGPGGFHRELVIKRILPHLTGEPGFVEMFLDEAKLAARLSHPNIVPVFDFGEVDGAFYLAMELVRGPDLRSVLDTGALGRGALSFPARARIVADAALGLEYAHRLTDADGSPLQIVHRDISPSNLIVSYDGITKILDFGIAKADRSSHKTRTGFIKGKLAYMPPEQVQAERLDGRADVYALGVVLYELCTGRVPFAGDSDFKLMRDICESEPPAPRSMAADVPEALEAVILEALAKDREDRFPSARTMATALERYVLSAEPPVGTFEVGEALRALRDRSTEPLDALARAGITSGSGEKPSLSASDPLGTGDTVLRPSSAERAASPEAPSGPDPGPDAPDVGLAASATALRPGAAEARPPAGLDAAQTAIRPPSTETASPARRTAPRPEASHRTAPSSSRKRLLLGGGVLAAVVLIGFVIHSLSPDEAARAPTPFGAPAAPRPDRAAGDAGTTPDGDPTVGAPSGSEAGSVETPPEPDASATEAGGDPDAPVAGADDDPDAPATETGTDRPAPSPDPQAAAPPADAPASPSPARPPPPRRDPAPEARRPPSTAADDPAPAPGFVMVQTQPWSEIRVGGRSLGQTPRRIELPPGRHVLELRNPEAGVERRVTVNVRAGATERVSLALGEGRVAVLVRPYGEVHVGGERRGVTPMPPLTLPAGRHTFEIVHPESGRRVTRTVEVVHGETHTLRVDLSE